MTAKQIELTCPCCASRLLVDVLTAKVLRSEKPASGGGGDPWAAAQDKVRGRTQSGTEKLDNALVSERGRKDQLEDLFRKANEKLKRKDEDDPTA